MPEVNIDTLYKLIGSAKANKEDAKQQARVAQLEAAKVIAHYDGAIQVLQMLLHEMQAQELTETASEGYSTIAAHVETTPDVVGASDGVPDAQNAMTIEQLQDKMPPGVSISGVVANEEE